MDILTAEFFAERLFGPDRAALLAAEQPASDADQAGRLDAQLTWLRTELRRIQGAQKNEHQRGIHHTERHSGNRLRYAESARAGCPALPVIPP